MLSKLNNKMMGIGAGLVAAGFFLGILQPFINLYDGGETQKVTVEGVATITAEQDEYVFYPNFTAKGKTRQAAIANVTKLGDKAVAALNVIGVDDSKLKVDISAYENWDCYDCNKPEGYVGNYSIQITSADEDEADEIQAYLLDSGAEGSLSPSASFSEERLAEIKSEARSKAVENARKQADQIASELDAEVKEVISIEEVGSFEDYPIFYAERASVSMDSMGGKDVSASDEVYVGEQDVTFRVKAVFEIK